MESSPKRRLFNSTEISDVKSPLWFYPSAHKSYKVNPKSKSDSKTSPGSHIINMRNLLLKESQVSFSRSGIEERNEPLTSEIDPKNLATNEPAPLQDVDLFVENENAIISAEVYQTPKSE
jgi:hypothetical protein